MPSQRRPEPHFTASRLVHDIVIGMSDGLTVPFAIAAGMSGAVTNTRLVIIAGLAEIAAGSISMGLGGYLSGRTDIQHYRAERERETRETYEVPKQETQEVRTILRDEFGLNQQELEPVLDSLRRDRDKWVDFMMHFELGLEAPEETQALRSALTIGLSYAVSGFIPLSPYFAASSLLTALFISIGVTSAALLFFGYIKGRVTGTNAPRSALQTFLIGGVAAAAAFGIARAID